MSPLDGLLAAVADDLGGEVISVGRLTGGDVAEAVRIDLVADGDGSSPRTVFAKTHASPPANFFSTEASGLEWLRSAGAVAVPEVLAHSDGAPDDRGPARLVLEWIEESGRPTGAHGVEEAFGRDLAALHRAGAPSFGRQDRRTTGSRGLPNEPCATWVEFYATQRLEPLARIARDEDALPGDVIDDLVVLAGRLDRLGVPVEPPARLHGDLWAGNRLVDGDGRSWLIDPAAHGGHREFDLAMMSLFGGFGVRAVAAYDEAHPLADGWQERASLHQIAPLVVHAIKFGGGYRAAAAAAIRRHV